MKLYAFRCAACVWTFRRILSDPDRAVACPLCGAQAVLTESAAAAPREAETQRVDRDVWPSARPATTVTGVCQDSPEDEAP